MADLQITPEQAQQLRDGGHISDDLLQRLLPQAAGSSEVPPAKDDLSDVPRMSDKDAEFQQAVETSKQENNPAVPRGEFAPIPQADPELDALNRVEGAKAQSEAAAKVQADAQAASAKSAQDRVQRYIQNGLTPPTELVAEANRSIAQDKSGDGAKTPVLASDLKAKQDRDPATERLNTYGNEMTGYMGAQADAIKRLGEVGAKQGAFQAAQLAGFDAQMKDYQKKSAAAEVLRQQELDSYRAKAEDSLAQANKLATVDPHHFWDSRTTTQKVAIGVGMLLGALGGSNGDAAIKVIGEAITRDLEAQKANAQNAMGVARERGGLYGQMLSQYRDQHLAENMTRAAMLDQVKLSIEAQAARYKGQEVAANAQLALGKLGMEQAELKNKIDQQLQTRQMMSGNGSDLNKVMFGAELVGRKPEDLQKVYGEWKDHKEATDAAMARFDDEAKNDTLAKRIFSLGQEGKRSEASEAAMLSMVRKAYGTRYSDTIADEAKKTFPGPGMTQKTIDEKRAAFAELLARGAPTDTAPLEALGIIKKRLAFLPRVKSTK